MSAQENKALGLTIGEQLDRQVAAFLLENLTLSEASVLFVNVIVDTLQRQANCCCWSDTEGKPKKCCSVKAKLPGCSLLQVKLPCIALIKKDPEGLKNCILKPRLNLTNFLSSLTFKRAKAILLLGLDYLVDHNDNIRQAFGTRKPIPILAPGKLANPVDVPCVTCYSPFAATQPFAMDSFPGIAMYTDSHAPTEALLPTDAVKKQVLSAREYGRRDSQSLKVRVTKDRRSQPNARRKNVGARSHTRISIGVGGSRIGKNTSQQTNGAEQEKEAGEDAASATTSSSSSASSSQPQEDKTQATQRKETEKESGKETEMTLRLSRTISRTCLDDYMPVLSPLSPSLLYFPPHSSILSRSFYQPFNNHHNSNDNNDNNKSSHDCFLYGQSISSYPTDPVTDIVADSFCVSVYDRNLVQLGVADGCNWGMWPAQAAQNALLGFFTATERKLKSSRITTLPDYARMLFNSVHAAHATIQTNHRTFLNKHSDQYASETDAGATTFLGGLVLRIEKREFDHLEDPEYVCLLANVGDCKAYLKKSTGELVDMTRGTRPSGISASDPGGYLGGDDNPDLRNLSILYCGLDKGDSIIMMTDGVHDNFDPVHLNLDSKEFGHENWEHFQADSVQQDVCKEKIIAKKLREEGAHSPKAIVETLMKHCIETTQSSRDFLASNPNTRLPKDYSRFPGKMDHTTCFVFDISEFEASGVGG